MKVQSFKRISRRHFQKLSYSVGLSDLSESEQKESDESIPDFCLLKPHNFEPLVKKTPNNTDLQTTEATTKRIGDTNSWQCGLYQPTESEAESLCCLDNKVPDDYFEGYY